MGCDIHAYLEYVSWVGKGGKEHWDCLAQNIGSQNYDLFGIMAGVRSEELKLYDPKGMPEGELSWTVRDAAYMRITDDPDLASEEGYTTAGQAAAWNEPIFMLGKQEFCSHPDWHNHSWLTADELKMVLGHFALHVTDHCYGIEWDAVLAAMMAFEERGTKTRLVFWFDN